MRCSLARRPPEVGNFEISWEPTTAPPNDHQLTTTLWCLHLPHAYKGLSIPINSSQSIVIELHSPSLPKLFFCHPPPSAMFSSWTWLLAGATASSIPHMYQYAIPHAQDALQNILRNTDGSENYKYPTDFTRGIIPV